MANFTIPVDWMPSKPLMVEILGGGDADGLYLDSTDENYALAKAGESIYFLTHGGKEGNSMTGMSVANVIRLRNGEELTDHQMGGQPHFYTVVERIEDDTEVLLRCQYTAGRTTFLKEHDASKPGWVNTAIRRFVNARFEHVDLNRIIEFWISRDLLSEVGTAIERPLIEEEYRTGLLDAKCDKLVANLLAEFQVEATYFVDDELIYFRPKPK